MRIWTVQHYNFYEHLLKNGFAYNEGRSTIDVVCPGRYDWIINQMNKRIGKPEVEDIEKPIWGWYKYNQKAATHEEDIEDSLDESMDYSAKRNVLIEADIPRERLLVTDYGLWFGTCLQGRLLTSDSLLCTFFYDVLKACNDGKEPGFKEMDDFFKSYIYCSWEKLIYEDPDGVIDVHPDPLNASKQVTFWSMNAKDVLSVKLYENDGELDNENLYQGDFHYINDITSELKQSIKTLKLWTL